jgi:poly-beta-1,6-N-acetyl-D-glucosamine synthase
MNVIALVPAHNEEEQVSATLDSLLAQTMPLDKILVILDNCTDSTEQIVAGYSTRFPLVEYMSSVDNPHKKAGALNQALPLCEDFKYILDTDADAILSPHFTELAVQEQDPRIGALSAREGIKEYPDATLKLETRIPGSPVPAVPLGHVPDGESC